jgi:hypothetical protein
MGVPMITDKNWQSDNFLNPKKVKKKPFDAQFKPLWVPPDIYYIQDGEYQHRSIAELMFDDYKYLLAQLKAIVSKTFHLNSIKQQKLGISRCLELSKRIKPKDELLKNLEYYLRAGESLAPYKPERIICPYCRKEQVRFFGLVKRSPRGFHINPELIYCWNLACKKTARQLAVAQYYQSIMGSGDQLLKFSWFDTSSRDNNESCYDEHRAKLKILFMKVFNLAEVNDKTAFAFFTNFNHQA